MVNHHTIITLDRLGAKFLGKVMVEPATKVILTTGTDMALVVTIHDMHVFMLKILKALCPFVAWSSPGCGQKAGQRNVVVHCCAPKRG